MSIFSCVHNDRVGNDLCGKACPSKLLVWRRAAASTAAEPWTGSHIPSRAIVWHAMSCDAMPFHGVPWHGIPCHTMACDGVAQTTSPKERGVRDQQKTRQRSAEPEETEIKMMRAPRPWIVDPVGVKVISTNLTTYH